MVKVIIGGTLATGLFAALGARPRRDRAQPGRRDHRLARLHAARGAAEHGSSPTVGDADRQVRPRRDVSGTLSADVDDGNVLEQVPGGLLLAAYAAIFCIAGFIVDAPARRHGLMRCARRPTRTPQAATELVIAGDIAELGRGRLQRSADLHDEWARARLRPGQRRRRRRGRRTARSSATPHFRGERRARRRSTRTARARAPGRRCSTGRERARPRARATQAAPGASATAARRARALLRGARLRASSAATGGWTATLADEPARRGPPAARRRARRRAARCTRSTRPRSPRDADYEPQSRGRWTQREFGAHDARPRLSRVAERRPTGFALAAPLGGRHRLRRRCSPSTPTPRATGLGTRAAAAPSSPPRRGRARTGPLNVASDNPNARPPLRARRHDVSAGGSTTTRRPLPD